MREKELPKIDTTKYIGRKTVIAEAVIKGTKFGPALLLKTQKLDDLPNDGELKASSMYSFGEDDEGHFIIKDSKLDKFIKAKGIDKNLIPEDLSENLEIPCFLGVEVVVQLNSKNNFLEIV